MRSLDDRSAYEEYVAKARRAMAIRDSLPASTRAMLASLPYEPADE